MVLWFFVKVECSKHGELEEVHFTGYSLGHDSEVMASELDLEGITFVLTVPDGDEVTDEDVDTVRNNERYLSKFADVCEDIAEAINGHIEWDSFVRKRAAHIVMAVCLRSIASLRL